LTIDPDYFVRNTCPRLASGDFEITSDPTEEYNCIAWAAGDTQYFWWPVKAPGVHWPDPAPLKDTREAFIAAFETLDYRVCSDGSLEAGYEKVAFYEDPLGKPKHMARQLPSGAWTSKLGVGWDIEHPSAEDVQDGIYGSLTIFMKREVRE
jgi:hypothetical protein